MFPYYRFYENNFNSSRRAAISSVNITKCQHQYKFYVLGRDGLGGGGVAHGRMHHKQLLIGPSNKTRRKIVEYIVMSCQADTCNAQC